jgi:hypothetical protein
MHIAYIHINWYIVKVKYSLWNKFIIAYFITKEVKKKYNVRTVLLLLCLLTMTWHF